MGKYILFIAVIFLTFIVQSITGFAGTVLAMPFSLMLVGYETAEPVLNIVGIVSSALVLFSCFKKVNKRELFKISAVMLIGIAVGFFFKESSFIKPQILYKILGASVIFFAVLSAYRFIKNDEPHSHGRALSAVILTLSGFVHGLFVCGGPLLVVYAGGKMRDRDEFRATLSAVWIVLNCIILAEDLSAGNISVSLLPLIAAASAVLVFAVIIGNLVYRKISRRFFLILTYALMFVSGVSLLIKK